MCEPQPQELYMKNKEIPPSVFRGNHTFAEYHNNVDSDNNNAFVSDNECSNINKKSKTFTNYDNVISSAMLSSSPSLTHAASNGGNTNSYERSKKSLSLSSSMSFTSRFLSAKQFEHLYAKYNLNDNIKNMSTSEQLHELIEHLQNFDQVKNEEEVLQKENKNLIGWSKDESNHSCTKGRDQHESNYEPQHSKELSVKEKIPLQKEAENSVKIVKWKEEHYTPLLCNVKNNGKERSNYRRTNSKTIDAVLTQTNTHALISKDNATKDELCNEISEYNMYRAKQLRTRHPRQRLESTKEKNRNNVKLTKQECTLRKSNEPKFVMQSLQESRQCNIELPITTMTNYTAGKGEMLANVEEELRKWTSFRMHCAASSHGKISMHNEHNIAGLRRALRDKQAEVELLTNCLQRAEVTIRSLVEQYLHYLHESECKRTSNRNSSSVNCKYNNNKRRQDNLHAVLEERLLLLESKYCSMHKELNISKWSVKAERSREVEYELRAAKAELEALRSSTNQNGKNNRYNFLKKIHTRFAAELPVTTSTCKECNRKESVEAKKSQIMSNLIETVGNVSEQQEQCSTDLANTLTESTAITASLTKVINTNMTKIEATPVNIEEMDKIKLEEEAVENIANKEVDNLKRETIKIKEAYTEACVKSEDIFRELEETKSVLKESQMRNIILTNEIATLTKELNELRCLPHRIASMQCELLHLQACVDGYRWKMSDNANVMQTSESQQEKEHEKEIKKIKMSFHGNDINQNDLQNVSTRISELRTLHQTLQSLWNKQNNLHETNETDDNHRMYETIQHINKAISKVLITYRAKVNNLYNILCNLEPQSMLSEKETFTYVPTSVQEISPSKAIVSHAEYERKLTQEHTLEEENEQLKKPPLKEIELYAGNISPEKATIYGDSMSCKLVKTSEELLKSTKNINKNSDVKEISKIVIQVHLTDCRHCPIVDAESTEIINRKYNDVDDDDKNHDISTHNIVAVNSQVKEISSHICSSKEVDTNLTNNNNNINISITDNDNNNNNNSSEKGNGQDDNYEDNIERDMEITNLNTCEEAITNKGEIMEDGDNNTTICDKQIDSNAIVECKAKETSMQKEETIDNKFVNGDTHILTNGTNVVQFEREELETKSSNEQIAKLKESVESQQETEMKINNLHDYCIMTKDLKETEKEEENNLELKNISNQHQETELHLQQASRENSFLTSHQSVEQKSFAEKEKEENLNCSSNNISDNINDIYKGNGSDNITPEEDTVEVKNVFEHNDETVSDNDSNNISYVMELANEVQPFPDKTLLNEEVEFINAQETNLHHSSEIVESSNAFAANDRSVSNEELQIDKFREYKRDEKEEEEEHGIFEALKHESPKINVAVPILHLQPTLMSKVSPSVTLSTLSSSSSWSSESLSASSSSSSASSSSSSESTEELESPSRASSKISKESKIEEVSRFEGEEKHADITTKVQRCEEQQGKDEYSKQRLLENVTVKKCEDGNVIDEIRKSETVACKQDIEYEEQQEEHEADRNYTLSHLCEDGLQTFSTQVKETMKNDVSTNSKDNTNNNTFITTNLEFNLPLTNCAHHDDNTNIIEKVEYANQINKFSVTGEECTNNLKVKECEERESIMMEQELLEVEKQTISKEQEQPQIQQEQRQQQQQQQQQQKEEQKLIEVVEHEFEEEQNNKDEIMNTKIYNAKNKNDNMIKHNSDVNTNNIKKIKLSRRQRRKLWRNKQRQLQREQQLRQQEQEEQERESYFHEKKEVEINTIQLKNRKQKKQNERRQQRRKRRQRPRRSSTKVKFDSIELKQQEPETKQVMEPKEHKSLTSKQVNTYEQELTYSSPLVCEEHLEKKETNNERERSIADVTSVDKQQYSSNSVHHNLESIKELKETLEFDATQTALTKTSPPAAATTTTITTTNTESYTDKQEMNFTKHYDKLNQTHKEENDDKEQTDLVTNGNQTKTHVLPEAKLESKQCEEHEEQNHLTNALETKEEDKSIVPDAIPVSVTFLPIDANDKINNNNINNNNNLNEITDKTHEEERDGSLMESYQNNMQEEAQQVYLKTSEMKPLVILRSPLLYRKQPDRYACTSTANNTFTSESDADDTNYVNSNRTSDSSNSEDEYDEPTTFSVHHVSNKISAELDN